MMKCHTILFLLTLIIFSGVNLSAANKLKENKKSRKQETEPNNCNIDGCEQCDSGNSDSQGPSGESTPSSDSEEPSNTGDSSDNEPSEPASGEPSGSEGPSTDSTPSGSDDSSSETPSGSDDASSDTPSGSDDTSSGSASGNSDDSTDPSGASDASPSRLLRYLAPAEQKCLKCKEDGYVINENATCDKCSDKFEGCRKCSQEECSECEAGLTLSSDKKGCQQKPTSPKKLRSSSGGLSGGAIAGIVVAAVVVVTIVAVITAIGFGIGATAAPVAVTTQSVTYLTPAATNSMNSANAAPRMDMTE